MIDTKVYSFGKRSYTRTTPRPSRSGRLPYPEVIVGLDTLLTGSQAARIAGVTRQLVRRWEQLGHLHRINGRYRARDVLEAEAKTRQRSGRQPCQGR